MAPSNSKILRTVNNEPWLPVNWPRYWPRQRHPISHPIHLAAPEWSTLTGCSLLDPCADSNRRGVPFSNGIKTPLVHRRSVLTNSTRQPIGHVRHHGVRAFHQPPACRLWV